MWRLINIACDKIAPIEYDRTRDRTRNYRLIIQSNEEMRAVCENDSPFFNMPQTTASWLKLQFGCVLLCSLSKFLSLCLSLFLFPLFFLSFQRQTANSFFMPTDCIVAFDYISICADSSFFPPHGFVNSRRTNNSLCPLVSRGIEYYVVAMDKWYLSSFFSLFPQKLLRKKNWIKNQTFIDIYSAKFMSS